MNIFGGTGKTVTPSLRLTAGPALYYPAFSVLSGILANSRRRADLNIPPWWGRHQNLTGTDPRTPPQELTENRSRLPSPIRTRLELQRHYRPSTVGLYGREQLKGARDQDLDPDSDRSSDEETVVGVEEEEREGIEVPDVVLGQGRLVHDPNIEMAYLHLFKPEQFSSEKNTIGVEDFLDTLELSFSCLDAIADEVKRERAKVLALQGHLEVKARAIGEMNVLSQRNLTSEQYVEKASDIFATLGDEYSMMLATKFVDGIVDVSTKVTIDAQFDEAYRFPEMLRVYEKCTKSLRHTETASHRPEEIKEDTKIETEILRETMKQNQQMVYQVIRSMNVVHLIYFPEKNKRNCEADSIAIKTHRQYRMVEVIQKDLQLERGGARGENRVPGENKSYLVAAADKRTRSERDGSESGDVLVQDAPAGQRRRKEGPIFPIPGIQEGVDRARQHPTFVYESSVDPTLNVPNNFPTSIRNPTQGTTHTGSTQPNATQGHPMPQPTQSHPMPQPTQSHPMPQPTQSHPMPQPPIPPQGRPFIPDPYYSIPAHQYQPQFQQVPFIPTAAYPRGTRKMRQPREPKPKRHIKMMKGCKEWDPMDSLRSLPVVGLDYGNLFDWAPGVRIAVGKALQMEMDMDKKKKGDKVSRMNPVLAIQEVKGKTSDENQGIDTQRDLALEKQVVWRSQIMEAGMES
ncbi:hypothetical protein BGX38DRAFT_1309683 [Terfezia claveryi]|nr:hypothetical protein BGX38DRAFT_1309683 [Terfezia claveryi]